MKTAIIYTRVSSADQVKGTSLESQEADIRRYCEHHGYEILAHFQDAGESAKTADRPGLINALAFARKHKPSVFVVHKLDRLSRNTADGLTIRAKLRAHETELVSATEAITADPVGDMVSTILLSVAQFDNQIRADRCKRGMREVTKKGGWAHRAPAGFLNTRREADGLSILIPDPQNAPAVTSALKGLASGSLSLGEAYAALERIGVNTAAAYKLFRNPLYAGILCGTETDFQEVKAAFPGLITPEEFTVIQTRLRPFGKKRQTVNADTPLRGILFCAACGAPLTSGMARSKTGAKHEQYWCHKCKGAKVSGKSARVQITELVTNSDFMADLLQATIHEVKKQTAKLVEETQRRQIEALQERQKAEKRLEKLTSGWVDGLIDDATFRARAAEQRLRIGELLIEGEDSTDTTGDMISRLESLCRILADKRKVFELLEGAKRQSFIEIVFGGFAVDAEKRLNYLNSNNPNIYNILIQKKEGLFEDGRSGGI